jgi:hypothetical protein
MGDCKIIALGSHASDYVLTSRVVHAGCAISLIETIGFCPASSHIFGLVRHTASQDNCRKQNDLTFHLIRRSTTITALVNRNRPAYAYYTIVLLVAATDHV